MARMKPKKCKCCGTEFEPFRSLQRVCSPMCAINLVSQENKKKERQETRKMREKLKSRSDWMREAQTAFNRYIRARDKGNGCISCGRNTGAKMNAGHYLTVGGHPELRFEENNCFLQCEHCNSYLSGNIARYRINLLAKIGLDMVEWIEGPHEPKKYTIEELKEIKRKYNRKAKEIEND